MNEYPGSVRTALVLLLAAAAFVMAACDGGRSTADKADGANLEATDGAGLETGRGGTLVAVGDSLTAGYGVSEKDAYPARLEQRLLAEGFQYRVVNAGISGETSSGTLSRIKWVLTLKPDIVILETGANDAFRGIPISLVESNINETVRILKENNVIVVLAGMQIVGNLGKDYATAFREIYPRVAEKQGIILIPFFLESVAGDPGLNQPDAIHPTAQGYEIVTKTIYPYVVEAIAKHSAARKAQPIDP